MLAGADHHHGLGEGGLIDLIQQPPAMVGMGVGDHHQVDLRGIDASSREIGGEMAGGLPKAPAGTAVHQDAALALVNQQHIGLGPIARARQRHGGSEGLEGGPVRVGGIELGGNHQIAVREHRQHPAPQPEAVEAGGLFALLGAAWAM